jgi:hypothetical protein
VKESTCTEWSSEYFNLFAGVNVVAGEFRITNEKFEPNLKDSTSVDFKQMAAQITQQVNINSANTCMSHCSVLRLENEGELSNINIRN